MKALLVIFVYISYVICQDIVKYGKKSFPKKTEAYNNGKILINSGNYKNKNYMNLSTISGSPTYTVFQVVGVSKALHGIPDSPYFPVDQTYENKPRVKKVLPEYSWSSLRNKRSAVLDEPLVEKHEHKREIPTTENKPESKVEKIVETTLTTTLTPKPPNNEEKPKVETKSSPTLDKQKQETKEVKKDTKSTNKVDPGGEITTKNLSDPHIGRSLITTKTVRKNVSNTVKNIDLKHSHISKNSSANIVRAKPKGKQTNAKTAVRANSKGKDPKNEVANIRNKKINTNSNVHRAGQKNMNKKKPPKRQRKQKAKNRGRSKKGQRTKQSNGTRTEKKPKAERRLIAGREALIEDYPYMVSLQKNNEHWCSGALLNPRLVITTANCLWKARRISRMEVRVGSRHTDRGGQTAGIQEVMKHPNWGLRKSPNNDIALVLLDKNIKFSDSVHSVDIPNRVMLPAFDDAWVTSWGTDRTDGVYSAQNTALQVYHARLMDRAKCNNVTIRFSVFVTENFICLTQSGTKAPCTRDTGAPAVSDGVLWGLASWGIRKLCGTERYPAVFSYLASHSNMDFITNATHFLMSDKRYSPFEDRPSLASSE